MKKIVTTDRAPSAIGPYSQAVSCNGMLYTSGQLGIDPKTGKFASGVEAQTEQALMHVQAILEEAGMTMASVIKTTVFIQDMCDFSKINSIYERFFCDTYPARSCVEVARLPKDGLVEIEVVAVRY